MFFFFCFFGEEGVLGSGEFEMVEIQKISKSYDRDDSG
jgi:hypothetical protein